MFHNEIKRNIKNKFIFYSMKNIMKSKNLNLVRKSNKTINYKQIQYHSMRACLN